MLLSTNTELHFLEKGRKTFTNKKGRHPLQKCKGRQLVYDSFRGSTLVDYKL